MPPTIGYCRWHFVHRSDPWAISLACSVTTSSCSARWHVGHTRSLASWGFIGRRHIAPGFSLALEFLDFRLTAKYQLTKALAGLRERGDRDAAAGARRTSLRNGIPCKTQLIFYISRQPWLFCAPITGDSRSLCSFLLACRTLRGSRHIHFLIANQE